jgi:hypothetical protein
VGRLRKVADSEAQFRDLAQTGKNCQEWFVEADEKAAAGRGLIPNADQCLRVQCAARIGRKWYSQSTIHRRSLRACLPSRGRESANCTPARWNYSSPSSEACSTPVVSTWDPRNLRTHLRSRNAIWEKRERFGRLARCLVIGRKAAIAASRSPSWLPSG